MKIRQTARHFAFRKSLETPGLRDAANYAMVRLHTKVFLGRADEGHREERREHLDALFDAAVDMYLAALQAGYSEAEAREITHVVANFDFYNHGWTEMMEFPADELDEHYERHREFFEAHGVGIDDPLGEFEPAEFPDAPATPEKLDAADYENAAAGYADDVYVEDSSGDVTSGDVTAGGRDDPGEGDPNWDREEDDPDRTPGEG